MAVAEVQGTGRELGKAESASIYEPDFHFQPRFVDIDGCRIAYFDEGEGPRTILMVHGNPVSGYVFVPLMRRLLADYRCIVPDLMGFGMSDKPADEAAYSLSGHIALMAGLVSRLGLDNVVLVGHDWGGPIGFGAAVREPDRYTHLVVLNTMTEAPMRIMPVYWIPFYVLLPMRRLFSYLVRDRGLFQRLGTAIMAPQDRAVYERANHDAATRAGIAAFPRMIPSSARHANYPLLKGILSALESWDIPSLVIFSDHDSVFTAEQGERFARQLVNARFKLVAEAKHFLQYEQPDLVERHIRDFLAER